MFDTPKCPSLTIQLSGCSSVVELLLPKQVVVGSIPITRSKPQSSWASPLDRPHRNTRDARCVGSKEEMSAWRDARLPSSKRGPVRLGSNPWMS